MDGFGYFRYLTTFFNSNRQYSARINAQCALTKIAKEKALSFEMRVPNTLTVATLEKSERGEDVHHAKDADDLFNQLGILGKIMPC